MAVDFYNIVQKSQMLSCSAPLPNRLVCSSRITLTDRREDSRWHGGLFHRAQLFDKIVSFIYVDMMPGFQGVGMRKNQLFVYL
jgi:hypothetical protein